MNLFGLPGTQASVHLANLLERRNLPSEPGNTVLQSQVDGLVGGFVQEATRPQTTAALVGAGLAYRLTRVGVVGSGLFGNSPLLNRAASLGLGLASESGIFTGINRGFNYLNGISSTQTFGHEWLHSAVTLGALKGFGRLGQGQNILTRHLLTDAGMVSGHQLAYHAGLQSRPEGTLAEQFLRAEAVNWQMAAGLSLLHHSAPGLAAAERALDLSSRPESLPNPFNGISSMRPALARATYGGSSSESSSPSDTTWMRRPSILAMAGEGNGASNSVDGRDATAEPPAEVLFPPKATPGGNGSSPQASTEAEPAPLETRPPQGPDLSGARYHLPKTTFFNETGPSLSFSKLLNYARSVSRAREVGSNTLVVLPTPLRNSEEYSPGGAAVVEHMREDPNFVHTLTGKWEWVLVASPSTAILGLGSGPVDTH